MTKVAKISSFCYRPTEIFSSLHLQLADLTFTANLEITTNQGSNLNSRIIGLI